MSEKVLATTPSAPACPRCKAMSWRDDGEALGKVIVRVGRFRRKRFKARTLRCGICGLGAMFASYGPGAE